MQNIYIVIENILRNINQIKKINIKVDYTNNNSKFNNDNQINKANNIRDENKQKSKNNRIIYESKKS